MRCGRGRIPSLPGGAVQSNHCRLTLAWAVKEGLDCHLILEERVKGSYKPEASGNNFLFQLLGVKSISVVPGGSDMMGEMQKLAETLRAEGQKALCYPRRGVQQDRRAGLRFLRGRNTSPTFQNRIARRSHGRPQRSAGTHAGIIAGMIGNNAGIPVTGIGVNRKKEAQQAAVLKLAQETLDYIGTGVTRPAEAGSRL